MTNSLFHRVLQHKCGEVAFTARYNINRLVYYEQFRYVGNCIAREKQLKGWSRAKKVALITSFNPTWEDLGAGWGGKVDLAAWASRFLAAPPTPKKQPLTRDGSASE
jgi:putative endonuclease